MSTIRAMVCNGRIEVDAPDGLPDGTDVLVDVIPLRECKIGLSESEWRDDPAALADWTAWLETIEPVEFANDDSFTEKVREFNIEAVRKQMALGAGE